jgi:hypothetical protein
MQKMEIVSHKLFKKILYGHFLDNDFADRIAKTRFFLDYRKRSSRPDLDPIEIQTRFDPTRFRHIGLRR